MDERMENMDLTPEAAEEIAAASIEVPETPADYQDMPDEDIVALCRTGDTVAVEYLLNKYKNFVRTKARSYFLIGADHEDIVQEGMIGLYKAIRGYDISREASFKTFAEECINNQILSAIKKANRLKPILRSPMTVLSPMVMPGITMTPAPNQQFLPIRTGILYCRPLARSSGSMGWPAVAMVTLGPIMV